MGNYKTNTNINIKNPDFWREVSRKQRCDCEGKGELILSEPKKEFWDSMARGYDDLENCADYVVMVNDIIESLNKFNALGKDKTVLDVGCGTGNYSVRFSPHCKEVVSLDISENMLRELRHKIEANNISNIKTIQADWRSFDIKSNNFEGAFDLVFVSMTPLTRDLDMVDKMISCSGNFLCIISWAGVKGNEIIDEITMDLWGKRIASPPDMIVTFNYLYSLGYAPQLKFYWGRWEKTKDFDDYRDYVIRFLENTKKLDDSEKNKITTKLKEKERDGKIITHTNVRIASLLIDINKKKEP